jgi:hypothetical protein
MKPLIMDPLPDPIEQETRDKAHRRLSVACAIMGTILVGFVVTSQKDHLALYQSTSYDTLHSALQVRSCNTTLVCDQ